MYLEGGDVGGEAVDAEHRLPGPAVPGAPCAADDLAVVLPDPAARVHREADVGTALAARAKGPEQVAEEEAAAAAAASSSVSLWRRAPAFRATVPNVAVTVAVDVRWRMCGFPSRPPGALPACSLSPPAAARHGAPVGGSAKATGIILLVFSIKLDKCPFVARNRSYATNHLFC